MREQLTITILEHDPKTPLEPSVVALPDVWYENKTFRILLSGRTEGGELLTFGNLYLPAVWARAYAEQLVLALGTGVFPGTWDSSNGFAKFTTKSAKLTPQMADHAYHFGLYSE